MPKPRFASSISQSANDFLSSFLIQRKAWKGNSTRRSKVTLLFSLTCRVDFFMLSPHNKPAFLALIPPSFTSPCSRNQVASTWVKKISVRSWVEFHFTTISYILSFNYSYRYKINLIRIMYTANSSILYSKEKTVRILGTWHQNLVNVSGFRYSKQIEFQEELINFLKTWLP